jgi:hypothetical protein
VAKRKPASHKPDWNTGARLQLLHFRSLSFEEKIRIVEGMEDIVRYFRAKRKRSGLAT